MRKEGRLDIKVSTLLFSVVLILCSTHLCAANPSESSADSVNRVHYLGVGLQGGVLIFHYRHLEYLRERNVKALEVTYSITDAGSRYWNRAYRLPDFGVTYTALDLGSPTYLGYSHSIVPYIAFPFTPQGWNLRLYTRWGFGISYLTKKYHKFENFKNAAIGSHLNLTGEIGAGAIYKVNQQFTGFLNYGIKHFSNATYQKPNSGLNYITLTLGVRYAISHDTAPRLNQPLFNDSKGRLIAVGAGSVKEEHDASGPKYWVGSLSMEYSRPINMLKRYGVSLDFMYDNSHWFLMESYRVQHPANHFDILRIGAAANYEVVIERLSVGFYLGYYLHNIGDMKGNIYQRVGFRYRVNNRVWAHMMLKTHLGSADYLELGVAYKIF